MDAPRYDTNCVERFLDYVKIDTQSREDSDSYPSTPGQLDLLRLLQAQCTELGLADVTMDEHGYVFATIPAPPAADQQGIALLLAWLNRAFHLMLALVFASIIILCLVTYRSLRGTLCIVLPLVVVSTLAEALMAVYGIGLKVNTLPVVALGIGIGVDYGVHLLHRWFESGGDPRALSATARAIAVAALTTATRPTPRWRRSWRCRNRACRTRAAWC